MISELACVFWDHIGVAEQVPKVFFHSSDKSCNSKCITDQEQIAQKDSLRRSMAAVKAVTMIDAKRQR